MTELRIQKIHIPDCEDAVLRAYYEWGRLHDTNVADPFWDDASPETRLAVARRGYSLYDGCPARPGDELAAPEIFLSVSIGSRVTYFDARRMLALADKTRPLLARLPDDARLEAATDEQVAVLAELLGVLRTAHQVDIGKATKVLHKKRPGLIPILDWLVVDFLWKSFPHLLNGQATVEDELRLFHQLLRARAEPLRLTQAALIEQGFHLSLTRLLDFLIWIGWYRTKTVKIISVWDAASIQEAHVLALAHWQAQEDVREQQHQP